MTALFAKYSNWTAEEIGQWWRRLIQRGPRGEREFRVQKNGHELLMIPMGADDGTLFVTSVSAKRASNAPTLQEWLTEHPVPQSAPPEHHYGSSDTSGQVANARFSFRNFRYKGDGDFIGEMVNDSGQPYQAVYFTLSVYDENGGLIDTGAISISNFEAAQTRSFDVYVEGVPSRFTYKLDFENGL